MKMVTNPHTEQELAQLAERFDHWRQHRTTPAEPIPQALWEVVSQILRGGMISLVGVVIRRLTYRTVRMV